jgi:hypothetical protein
MTAERCSAGLRQIDFTRPRDRSVDKILGADAISDPDAPRLIDAARRQPWSPRSLCSARSATSAASRRPRQLVAISAWIRGAPVRQRAAKHGKISKQGPGDRARPARRAAWHAARTAGPLRAFHQRIAARRGSNVATVATARKTGR